jgi:hypothetical protein
MKRNDVRKTQRGFFAVGFALALLAGFSLAGWGVVELAESDEVQVVVEPAPLAPTVAAQTGHDAGAN